MAETDTKTADEKPSKAAARESASQDDATLTFAVSDLVARAPEYLGVPVYVAAGGLADKKSPMTVTSAQTAIKSWLGAPATIEE